MEKELIEIIPELISIGKTLDDAHQLYTEMIRNNSYGQHLQLPKSDYLVEALNKVNEKIAELDSIANIGVTDVDVPLIPLIETSKEVAGMQIKLQTLETMDALEYKLDEVNQIIEYTNKIKEYAMEKHQMASDLSSLIENNFDKIGELSALPLGDVIPPAALEVYNSASEFSGVMLDLASAATRAQETLNNQGNELENYYQSLSTVYEFYTNSSESEITEGDEGDSVASWKPLPQSVPNEPSIELAPWKPLPQSVQNEPSFEFVPWDPLPQSVPNEPILNTWSTWDTSSTDFWA